MNKSKILAQFIAGVLGCVILGIAGLAFFMTYGGNYGCSEYIDKLMGSVGYESCGGFGAIIGALTGTIIGTLIISKVKTTNYLQLSILLAIITFIIPFNIGVFIFGENHIDLISISLLTLKIISFSIIPSFLITTIIILCSKPWKKM